MALHWQNDLSLILCRNFSCPERLYKKVYCLAKDYSTLLCGKEKPASLIKFILNNYGCTNLPLSYIKNFLGKSDK
ncbi:2529_t:CDS:2 [Rhizophagus irregularis]|nr:2529_t:CDS:2 [Rhizophagus irregularis]